MAEATPQQAAQRGFALLVVLWSVALLALLAVRLTATGRNELLLATNIRNAAVVQAQSDALTFSTIVRLMRDTPAERGVDGLDHTTTVPGGQATIRVTSLAGKINPNAVSDELLKTLMQQLGVSPAQAGRLAAAIADWRSPGQQPRPGGAKAAQYSAAGLSYTPPGAPFESVSEVGLVLGMTPDLFERMAPHLTVFYPADPVWTAADPVVARVLQTLNLVDVTASPEGADNDADDVEISVRVTSAIGSAFTRRAVAWVGHGLLRGRYRILRWDEGS